MVVIVALVFYEINEVSNNKFATMRNICVISVAMSLPLVENHPIVSFHVQCRH
jgi:hypothetical protein